MSRLFTKSLVLALALGAGALAAEPASATPMAGAAAIERAVPGTAADAEQVYFRRGFGYRRGFGFRRGFGYRRPFGYRRFGYGYRLGLPGHPIRRLLRRL